MTYQSAIYNSLPVAQKNPIMGDENKFEVWQKTRYFGSAHYDVR
jgi:hypothetical protein